MPAPSNSALFKGIGGDLGHRLSLSPASVISDHFHVFFLKSSAHIISPIVFNSEITGEKLHYPWFYKKEIESNQLLALSH